MPKRRLFHPSESPVLNSSMESRSHSVSPPGVQTRRGKKCQGRIPDTTIPSPEKNGEEFESSSTQYSPDIESTSEQPHKERKVDLRDNAEGNSEKTENSSIQDSDDSMDVPGFFSSNFEKRPYTLSEDEEILKYVLKDQNIYRVSSILLWKYLEAKKKVPHRTYQSLKNRFLRSIKPKLFTTYRYLIKNEDQVKNILTKFPELKKDANKQRLLFEKERSKTNERVENITPTKTKDQSTPKVKDSVRVQTHSSAPVSQVEISTSEEKTTTRIVKLSRDKIVVSVSCNTAPDTSSSSGPEGIYEKYLRHKAKNKLIPCSACGRCGNPEDEKTEDREHDEIIPDSCRHKKV